MGFYPVEKKVLDRFDAGQSIEEIIRATGFLRSTVQNIVHRFDVNLDQDVARENAIRTHTAQLGELVRQAGGHR